MSAFRDLPLRAKVYVIATVTVGSAIAIAYTSFVAVTLRQTMAATSPWEAVGAFLVVTVALVIAARLMGLHESR